MSTYLIVARLNKLDIIPLDSKIYKKISASAEKDHKIEQEQLLHPVSRGFELYNKDFRSAGIFSSYRVLVFI